MSQENPTIISKLKDSDAVVILCIFGSFASILSSQEPLRTWFWIFIVSAIILYPLAKKTLIIYLFAYFFLTCALWMSIRGGECGDWFFYKHTLDILKKPELSQDVTLIDIAYPDRLTFRKNVGLFLQKLAKQPERPLAVGLDIVYKKFEQITEKSRSSTRHLIKGVQALTDKYKGVPVIAAYHPDKSLDYYDKKLFGQTSPFTDIGHNIVQVRDGKFHAKVFEEVFEEIRSESQIGTELKIFFAVLLVKHGNNLGDNYPGILEKKYHNILPIRYQKKFAFDTYTFPNKKLFARENPFAGKTVIIGSLSEDYKEDQKFYGLHAIAYATQILTDQAKGKDILIAFESRIWIILFTAIFFSLIEIGLFSAMLFLSDKLKTRRIAPSLLLLLLLSGILTTLIFFAYVLILSRSNLIFADFTIVLAGILISGLLFSHYQRRIYGEYLGSAWDSKGDYDKALDIDLKVLGNEQPVVADSYNDLGKAWTGKEEYGKAIAHLEKGLSIDLKVFENEHPNIAREYNNLGEAWREKGDYKRAVEYLEKSLKIFKKYLAPDHPSVKTVEKNIRILKKKMKK